MTGSRTDAFKLADKAAPLKAMLTPTSGMLSQESIDAPKAEAHGEPRN
ncbi:hypothetical protein JOD97_000842 [Duganella sp. 1411]|jgi:hypothetical protein|nr:hypothetical protein [Duganella sp. 1411]MBP1202828.1 hypothetical protein [Duganella sp. 1411]